MSRISITPHLNILKAKAQHLREEPKRLMLPGSCLLVFFISLFTQGFNGSTVVHSLLSALGGGLAGVITALIIVALRLLFSKNGWKLISLGLGLGIILAVLTGATVLEVAMPAMSGVLGYLVGLVLICKAFIKITPRTELPTTFGTARWATRDDLDIVQMIGGIPAGSHLDGTNHAGLFLGQTPETGEAIIYDGDMHVVTIAPTRTGKDQTAILPNLVRSTGSMLVIDPKGESTRRTLERRRTLGSETVVLDPWSITTEADTYGPGIDAKYLARFNPLDRLKADDPDLAGDVMLYADALVTNESQNPHWPNEAKALIAGFIAYIVTDPLEAQRRHLGRLRDILCLPFATRDKDGNPTGDLTHTLDEVLGRMIASKTGFVRNSAFRFLQKEERERAGVIATAHANTHFLESPRIRESLSKSDFAFADLKTGDTPVTVYLALPLDRLNAFGRWLRLLVSTALIELTRAKADSQTEPVRFILNEFAALGRLDAVETAFGTMAGLGVQLWAITQDLSQLKRLYGAENWQTFVANAGVFQYFGSRDYETAKYAEHLCGFSTLKKRSISFGSSTSASGHGSSETVSIDDVQRPLIFADELMRLPRDQQLLLIENLPPITAQKWWWYKNQDVQNAFDGGVT